MLDRDDITKRSNPKAAARRLANQTATLGQLSDSTAAAGRLFDHAAAGVVGIQTHVGGGEAMFVFSPPQGSNGITPLDSIVG